MAVFADVIRGERQSPVDHHDAAAAFRIAAAAQESQKRGQPVEIAEMSAA